MRSYALRKQSAIEMSMEIPDPRVTYTCTYLPTCTCMYVPPPQCTKPNRFATSVVLYKWINIASSVSAIDQISFITSIPKYGDGCGWLTNQPSSPWFVENATSPDWLSRQILVVNRPCPQPLCFYNNHATRIWGGFVSPVPNLSDDQKAIVDGNKPYFNMAV